MFGVRAVWELEVENELLLPSLLGKALCSEHALAMCKRKFILFGVWCLKRLCYSSTWWRRQAVEKGVLSNRQRVTYLFEILNGEIRTCKEGSGAFQYHSLLCLDERIHWKFLDPETSEDFTGLFGAACHRCYLTGVDWCRCVYSLFS